ncbi:MAG: c-type cytochrome [Candidatus Dormibacteraceae bacterium]
MPKTPPKWILPALVAFVVPALLVGFGVSALAKAPASGGTATAASSSKKPALPPGSDPAKGATVYASNCATCHGANLEGGIGPRLNPLAAIPGRKVSLSSQYLVSTIQTGVPGTQMPAWAGKLSSKDITDLAAFIIKQNEAPAAATYSPQDLARSTVTWVILGILAMVIITWVLARYNMRWVARKAANRR